MLFFKKEKQFSKILSELSSNKVWLVVDQALSSLLNFGSVFLLSALADVSVFRDFVLLYSYCSLLYTITSFYLSSPILVFFKKKWEHQELAYIVSIIISGFFGLIVLSSLIYFFLKLRIEISFFSFFLFNFLWVVYDILKRVIFAGHRIDFTFSVISSGLVIIVFLMTLLGYRVGLDIFEILQSYIFGYFVAILLLGYKIFSAYKISLSEWNRLSVLKLTISDHYTYSKWIMAGGILFWTYSQGVFVLADIIEMSGEDIGKVRVIQNLLGVFTILMVALENHFIPKFANSNESGIKLIESFYDKLTKPLLVLFFGCLPILIGIYNLFYQDKYGDGLNIILIIWLSQLSIVFFKPFSFILRSKLHNFPFFISNLLSFIVLSTCGVFLSSHLKSEGLAITILITYFVSSITIWFYYRKLMQRGTSFIKLFRKL